MSQVYFRSLIYLLLLVFQLTLDLPYFVIQPHSFAFFIRLSCVAPRTSLESCNPSFVILQSTRVWQSASCGLHGQEGDKGDLSCFQLGDGEVLWVIVLFAEMGKDWLGVKFTLGHVEPSGCPYGATQRVADHPGLVCWGMVQFG